MNLARVVLLGAMLLSPPALAEEIVLRVLVVDNSLDPDKAVYFIEIPAPLLKGYIRGIEVGTGRKVHPEYISKNVLCPSRIQTSN